MMAFTSSSKSIVLGLPFPAAMGSGSFYLLLEVVSKPQIRFNGKAQADAKAQHTCEYVSILRRFATPPLGIRCIFEIGSNNK
jgi:hypothetical protein